MQPNKKIYVRPNTFFIAIMPHSEVCMHMRIAGQPMACQFVGPRAVQLYQLDCKTPFSAPILRGEAGVFEDEHGTYIWRNLPVPSPSRTCNPKLLRLTLHPEHDYRRTKTMQLDTLKDESGKWPAYAWPGGYPIYYLMDDGEALCPACANDPTNPVHQDSPDDGWRMIAADINWEDPQLFCAHCNKRIESAYAEDDENTLPG